MPSEAIHVVKFGGSILTHPDAEGLFHAENVRRLAGELAAAGRPCLLVHGTGLVGKRPAREYGYVDDGILPPGRADIAARINRDLRRMAGRILHELAEAGLRPVPLSAVDYFTEAQDALRDPALADGVRAVLAGGGLPVFRGQLVPQEDGSFRVLSSDTITAILARALRPAGVFLLTDVPGVLAGSPEDPGSWQVLPELRPPDLARMGRLETDARDVSGGMAAKVRTALAIAGWAGRCAIACGGSPGGLLRLLRGQPVPCTWVVPDEV